VFVGCGGIDEHAESIMTSVMNGIRFNILISLFRFRH
jgi:hypothetical protein